MQTNDNSRIYIIYCLLLDSDKKTAWVLNRLDRPCDCTWRSLSRVHEHISLTYTSLPPPLFIYAIIIFLTHEADVYSTSIGASFFYHVLTRCYRR